MAFCIDSHTAGEPTRLVLSGYPEGLPSDPKEAASWLDHKGRGWMRGVLCEPRGHEAMVGAVLLPGEPHGLVFFNNLGTLRMCGHGVIGVAASLAQTGTISAGAVDFVTPVGVVTANIDEDLLSVTIENVESFVVEDGIRLEVDDEPVKGAIVWGGNGFFITESIPCPLLPENIHRLLEHTAAIKEELQKLGKTGSQGLAVDHIELSSQPHDRANSARNFVLCPGNQYDRSPCGTGTSAKMALLAHRGQLAAGETWRQEGILGTVFEGSYRQGENGIHPRITGAAYITAEVTLRFDPVDPLRHGIHFV